MWYLTIHGLPRTCYLQWVLVILLFGFPPLYMSVATPKAGLVKEVVTINPDPDSRYLVAVANWGYHTSILVEQPSGWQLGPSNAAVAPFIEYGWGDKQFYMNSDRSVLTIIAAMLWPTESVVYVQGWWRLPTPEDGIRRLYQRQVSAAQLRQLVIALEQSFQRTPRGERLPPFPPLASFQGQFYLGREFYIFWSACNAWTVRQLANGDLTESGWPVVLLAEQVAPRLRWFQRVF